MASLTGQAVHDGQGLGSTCAMRVCRTAAYIIVLPRQAASSQSFAPLPPAIPYVVCSSLAAFQPCRPLPCPSRSGSEAPPPRKPPPGTNNAPGWRRKPPTRADEPSEPAHQRIKMAMFRRGGVRTDPEDKCSYHDGDDFPIGTRSGKDRARLDRDMETS